MNIFSIAILALYYPALAGLAIYGAHRLYLVGLRRRHAPRFTEGLPQDFRWPSLTIQLPVFNEPNVAGRLLDAVGQISYPGAFDIQVLDDSTDETSEIVERKVMELRRRGVGISHCRRARRDGFKAGALANGFARSGSELFAVFDADFVPPPHVLSSMVPHFLDPSVGMVQARWGHLNREESRLTKVQAIFLDSHFAVESAARFASGRFFNFNGTAGLWRREAIQDAGGWSASTLTEDLDLSYRAQLAGWRFMFLPDLSVEAELPSTLHGFQEQQFRWAKGSIQTALKLLPAIARAPLSLAVKTEAFFHLSGNCAYVLTLLVAVLVVPAITIRQEIGLGWTLLVDFFLFVLSTGSVLVFFADGQRRVGRRLSFAAVCSVLPVGIGMSARNAAAVLEGLLWSGGDFHRTPKSGGGLFRSERRPRLPVAEMILTAFFLVAVGCFIASRQWISLPFLILFLSGFGWVSALALGERVAWWRQRLGGMASIT